ncbi:DUF2946 family protein [Thioclava sp. GXIMD4216]|uniref:DUF2946 family protein n=1 Tax=Thioclava sp. GXIMD4216 TaxID=3131929 RepID=UPI0030D201AD
MMQSGRSSPPRAPGGRSACSAGAGVWLLRLCLLCALFLSGIVPQDMMRNPDAEGTTLVLCTGEGPKELVMLPDGSVKDPDAPAPQRHKVSTCLAVSLSLAAVQAVPELMFSTAEFSRYRPAPAPAPPVILRLYAPVQPRAPPRAA